MKIFHALVLIAWLLFLHRISTNRQTAGKDRESVWAVPAYQFLALAAGCVLLFWQGYWQIFGHLNKNLFQARIQCENSSRLQKVAVDRGLILSQNRKPLVKRMEPTGRKTDGAPCYRSVHPALHCIAGQIKDATGCNGLELRWDDYLMGRELTKDSWLTFVLNGLLPDKMRGNDLVLTISRPLQEAIHEITGDAESLVLVADPKTGRMLAAVSKESGGTARLMQNALQEAIPVGTLFQWVGAIASINRSKNYSVICRPTGFLPPGGRVPIIDPATGPNAREMGLEEGIIQANRTYFAQLPVLFRQKPIWSAVERIDLRNPPALSGLLAKEEAGENALPNLKRTTIEESCRIIADGDRVFLTPLTLLKAAAIIAADGRAVPFSIVASLNNSAAQALPMKTARSFRGSLYLAVNRGHAKGARVRDAHLAGSLTRRGVGGKSDRYIFLGMFPADNPDYVLLITVRGQNAGSEVIRIAKATVGSIMRIFQRPSI